MATNGIVDHLPGTNALFSNGPNTDAQNHDRPHGNILKDLYLPSISCSYSSDHLSHCPFVTTAVWILFTKL